MRIRELFENTHFKDTDYVEDTDNGRQINYDLKEDLIHFMNNDDSVYRRHFYPAISKCINQINSDKKVNPGIFKSAVEMCYEAYTEKFPIRELPRSLDLDTCKDICKSIYEEVRKHIDDGKYED